MPRKNLPKSEKRDERFNVYANEAEAKIIREKAKKTGMSPTDYLRTVGLGKHIRATVPEINLEKWKELDSLTKIVNRIMSDPDKMLDGKIDLRWLHHLRFEVQKVRMELIIDRGCDD
jgi:NCAIR mutase (PurE)-related protein